jgi:hypothetical protein
VEWFPRIGLSLYGELAGYEWREEDRRQRYVGATLGADWQVGKLTVGARYTHLSWSFGREQTDDGFLLRVARAF